MSRLLAFMLGCVLGVGTAVVAHGGAGSTTPLSSRSIVAQTIQPSVQTTRQPWTDRASRSEKRKPLHRHHSRPSASATSTTTVAPSPAPAYTSTGSVWDALAGCEAGGNWHINTGNGFYGGLQITAGNAAHYGYGRPDLLSREAQITLGRQILRDQGPGAWPVCGPRVGLSPGD